jgi:drug/metabolite transporter (DMT)-like permease
MMTGEIAALSAALLWALASILFAGVGRHIRAINLNLIKGLLACTMMLATLFLGSIFNIEGFDLSTLTAVSSHGFVLLVISGIIGIGAGDTAYFACLRRIGPQNGLMLESTAPIIASLLALLLFQEVLSGFAWMGICLTTTGVILVVKWSQSSYGYSTNVSGVSFGILAAFCQASGIVLSRQALLLEQVEPLASALIRLSAALLMIIVWFVLRQIFTYGEKSRQSIGATLILLINKGLVLKVFAAIVMGTFLGIWLMQTSVKYTSAGITQTLLASSPLFGMLLARIRGQKQIGLVWVGLLLGLCGIGLLFIR